VADERLMRLTRGSAKSRPMRSVSHACISKIVHREISGIDVVCAYAAVLEGCVRCAREQM
jgi:hypothetical protein